MPNPAALLPRLVEIAAAAGTRIVAVRERPLAVTAKSDGTPLTEADLAAGLGMPGRVLKCCARRGHLAARRLHMG